MDTIITLTPIDFEKYKIFLEMDKKGCFGINFGKCTINFAYGELQNIIKEEIVWKKSA